MYSGRRQWKLAWRQAMEEDSWMYSSCQNTNKWTRSSCRHCDRATASEAETAEPQLTAQERSIFWREQSLRCAHIRRSERANDWWNLRSRVEKLEAEQGWMDRGAAEVEADLKTRQQKLTRNRKGGEAANGDHSRDLEVEELNLRRSAMKKRVESGQIVEWCNEADRLTSVKTHVKSGSDCKRQRQRHQGREIANTLLERGGSDRSEDRTVSVGCASVTGVLQ